MVYPYTQIVPRVSNVRISLHLSVFESKWVPVRTLIEMPLVCAFAEKRSKSVKVTLSDDNLSIPGHTQNTNRDPH